MTFVGVPSTIFLVYDFLLTQPSERWNNGMKYYLKLQFFLTSGNFHLLLLQKELKLDVCKQTPKKKFGLSYEDENTFFEIFSTYNKYAILQYIHSKTKKDLCKRRFMKVKRQVHESKNASPYMISPCRGRHPPKPSVINRMCSKKKPPQDPSTSKQSS